MIALHVHHFCRNKDKYSCDQLMKCSLPHCHCLHTLSADRLLAVTLLQSLLLSLTLIHTQPLIGLSKLSYTAATLNFRLLSQIIILLNIELLIVINFKFSCVYLIISTIFNILSDL